MKQRRRWWLAGAAGVVAAVSLLMVPAFGDGPVIEELGVLRLHLDSDGDRVTFIPAAGSNQTQTLTAGTNCKFTSTGASLVSFAASGTPANKNPFPGLKDHRLGVGQTGEGTGEPCARINKDKSQTLTLSLTGALDGAAVDYAEIDLGFKFNGSATLELRRGGSLVGTILVPCGGASDCGPDSGGSDNERVILFLDPADDPGAGHWQAFPITDAFDTIVIKPSEDVPPAKGVVSLEGGSNGSLPGPKGGPLDDSYFRIVEAFDGVLDCTESTTLIEGENATFDVTRGLDTDGGCKGPTDGLLFTFDAGVEGDELFVDFITEPVDENPDTVAQFLEVITWRFDGPPNVDADEAQHRTLSYDDHLTPSENKQVMPWCIKDPRDASGNLPVGTVSAPVNPLAYVPAGHTSCLIESRSRVTGLLDILSYPLGTFVKEDIVYNFGDGKRWT